MIMIIVSFIINGNRLAHARWAHLELELLEGSVARHQSVAVVVAVTRQLPQRLWADLTRLLLQKILHVTVTLGK